MRTLCCEGTAAPTTTTRKHAVLHAALGYAAETGLLDANPLDTTSWHIPRSSAAVNPAVMAGPEQVQSCSPPSQGSGRT